MSIKTIPNINSDFINKYGEPVITCSGHFGKKPFIMVLQNANAIRID